MIFTNRCDAGRRLASALVGYQDANPLVLGLPRGGVPVAYEVAHTLGVPFDVLVVRKLGAPGHAELAMGAVSRDVLVLDEELVGLLGVPRTYIDAVVERERTEVRRRERRFRGERRPLDVRGRTVIVVDDGIATGSTMLAAVDAVRRMGAGRVVVAVPVAPPQSVNKLRAAADEVVCLETPADFPAVGAFYEDFRPVVDEEVSTVLGQGRLERGGPKADPAYAACASDADGARGRQRQGRHS